MNEEKEKCCPMSFNRQYIFRCKGKDCGWWNNANSCCSLITLANSAIDLAEVAVGQRIIFTKEI